MRETFKGKCQEHKKSRETLLRFSRFFYENSGSRMRAEIPVLLTAATLQGIPIAGIDQSSRRAAIGISWWIDFFTLAGLGMTIGEIHDAAEAPVAQGINTFPETANALGWIH